jgi:hypothetical protein
MKPAKRARTMMADQDHPFVKQAFCGPVTALCWVPDADLLLSGRGTDVLAARVTGLQQQQLGAMRLFTNGRVHGIKGRVCAGGASLPQPRHARVLVAAHSEKNVSVAELTIHSAGSQGISTVTPSTRVLARLWQLDDWYVRPVACAFFANAAYHSHLSQPILRAPCNLPSLCSRFVSRVVAAGRMWPLTRGTRQGHRYPVTSRARKADARG